MWIRPHENLMVWSIREDLFGHDRHTPLVAGRVHGAHAHRRIHGQVHESIHVTAEPKSNRLADRVDLVTQANSAQPVDCHPCDCGSVSESGEYVPYLPGVWEVEAPQSDPPTEVIIYFDKTGLSQGFTHGQLVPAAGSLLDIFA